MKKIFFLIALLFTVVCYAAPPPNQLTELIANDVQFVVHQVDISIQPADVQEVAFNYIGNSEIATNSINQGIEMEVKIEFPELQVINNSLEKLDGLNKPPSLICNEGVINSNSAFMMDIQNSNYGYPFGADYVFS